MKTRTRAVFAVASLFSAACSTPTVNPDNLARQWGDRLRAYQIFPVFPPREDLQVGDVYMVCDLRPDVALGTEPSSTQSTPQSMWVARLDLSSTLEEVYSQSIRLPALPDKSSKGALADPNGIGSMPKSNDMISKKRKLEQLRNVSFPEFFSTSITAVQANALVPAGVVLAGLGLSSNDVASISLNIPAAGSYGIPVFKGQLAINKAINGLGKDFWPNATGMLESYADTCDTTQIPTLLAITEIYAAYAISVNFSFEKGTAARLQASLNEPGNSTRNATLQALTKQVADVQKATAAAPDKESTEDGKAAAGKGKAAGAPNPASDSAVVNAKISQQDQLNAMLNALVQQATGFEQQKFAGVSAQIVSGSTSGVHVERVFSNPVVVGYKAIILVPPEGKNPASFGPPPRKIAPTNPTTLNNSIGFATPKKSGDGTIVQISSPNDDSSGPAMPKQPVPLSDIVTFPVELGPVLRDLDK